MKNICLLIFLLILIPSLQYSQTNVSGFISQNTTWTLNNSPFIVTGSLIVNPGITLTIEPGVTVKINNGFAIRIDGKLSARGTSQSNIIFTSGSSNPSPGSWAYISFTNSAEDAVLDPNGNYISGCILEYCSVLYGGGIQGTGAIFSQESSPLIKNCIIKYNNNSGIHAVKSRISIQNNDISNNNGKGIYINNENFSTYTRTNLKIVNNTIANNSADGIRTSFVSSDTLVIMNNTVTSNHGEGGLVLGSYTLWDDGGLWLRIINNTVQGNTGTRAGGITCFRPRFAEISNNTIAQNTGNDIGGLYYHADFDPAKLVMTNNIIKGNTAQKYSACYINIFSPGVNSTANISGNSFISNISTASNYGAICIEGDVNYNNIVFNASTNVIRKNTGSYTIVLKNAKGYLNSNNIDSNSTIYDIYCNNTATSPSFNARRNYWGTANINVINNRVFDFFDDPSRGVVLLDSFVTDPFPIGIIKQYEEIPAEFSLKQNYPNPFNPKTTIVFNIPIKSFTTLKIYNILGEEIINPVHDILFPGTYKYEWIPDDIPSGIYFYRIESSNFTEVKKMIFIK